MWKRILAVAALVMAVVGGVAATSSAGGPDAEPVGICGLLCGDNHNQVLLTPDGNPHNHNQVLL